MVGILLSTPAPAQDGNEDGSDGGDSDGGGTLSPQVYRQVQEINEAIDNDNLEEAESGISDLLENGLSDYEQGVVLRLRAYVAAERDNYPSAIDYFEQALNTGAFEKSVQNDLRYNLGQLNLAEDNYQKAVDWLTEWRAQAKQPSGSSLMLLASAQAQVSNYDAAIEAAQAAIDSGDTERSNWYRFLASMHLQKDNLEQARSVLETGILLFPDSREMWLQLSAVYGEQDKMERALAVLQLADSQGMVREDSQVRYLTQLHLNQDIPYFGAAVLDRELEEGNLDAGVRNYDLLATAYSLAREHGEAVKALRQTLEQERNGETLKRIGRLEMLQLDWEAAAEAYGEAVEAGGLEKPGQALLSRGIALFRAEKKDTALEAFQQATDYDSVASQARAWVQQLTRDKSGQRPGSG